MQLVFIHGWGFDASLWDAVSALLPSIPQQRVELGFFGAATSDIAFDANSILIGHSLGFVQGLRRQQKWAGWIAINSFPRFIATAAQPGCVPPAILRDMKMRLKADPRRTLDDFYRLIGASSAPAGDPDSERLQAGLDALRDIDAAQDAAALPGLVLAARHDPLVPESISVLLAKNQTAAWHDQGGHLLPLSDPHWCARHIETFLAQYGA